MRTDLPAATGSRRSLPPSRSDSRLPSRARPEDSPRPSTPPEASALDRASRSPCAAAAEPRGPTAPPRSPRCRDCRSRGRGSAAAGFLTDD